MGKTNEITEIMARHRIRLMRMRKVAYLQLTPSLNQRRSADAIQDAQRKIDERPGIWLRNPGAHHASEFIKRHRIASQQRAVI
jgi:hypothetical protein